MHWGGKVIVGTALAVAAFVIGVDVGDDPIPPPPAPVIKEVPKYIDREKVVEKRVVPKVCLDAIAAASQANKATGRYEKLVGALPDLLDDSYKAIYDQDLNKLNKLKEKEIKLEGDSIQALLDIRDAQERLDKLQPKCDAATR